MRCGAVPRRDLGDVNCLVVVYCRCFYILVLLVTNIVVIVGGAYSTAVEWYLHLRGIMLSYAALQLLHSPSRLGDKSDRYTVPLPSHSQRSCSSISTQVLSNPISRRCIFRPAGVSACFPAPQPNGSTNLRLPCPSITTRASRGNLPPPSGCRRPRRTK